QPIRAFKRVVHVLNSEGHTVPIIPLILQAIQLPPLACALPNLNASPTSDLHHHDQKLDQGKALAVHPTTSPRKNSRTRIDNTPMLISASPMPPEAYSTHLATAQEDSPCDVSELAPPHTPPTPAFCETLGRTQGLRESPKIGCIPGRLLR